jgi:hypothetical protein
MEKAMRMTRRVGSLSVALALVVGTAAFTVRWASSREWDPALAYFRKSATELRGCRSLEAVRALPDDGVGDLVIWQFRDGSWVAARSHPSDHAAQDWNATVILDSKGRLYRTDYHFCAGFEQEKS